MSLNIVNLNIRIRHIALLPLVVTAYLAAASDIVEFKIVDRIKFSVPGDWPVIANSSSPEKTVFGFQIPNPADEGTPDSSNLAIVSSYLKDAKDRDAFEKQAAAGDPRAEEKKLVEGWRCSSFSAQQKSTPYTIWDCHRIVADCGVSVRIAWPRLPNNPSDYDQQMEKLLTEFLVGVRPQKGSK